MTDSKKAVNKSAMPAENGSGPKLLAGGNPQIPKGDGDGPVQAYIAAMPGWKSDLGRYLDDLLVRTVLQVRSNEDTGTWRSARRVSVRGSVPSAPSRTGA